MAKLTYTLSNGATQTVHGSIDDLHDLLRTLTIAGNAPTEWTIYA